VIRYGALWSAAAAGGLRYGGKQEVHVSSPTRHGGCGNSGGTSFETHYDVGKLDGKVDKLIYAVGKLDRLPGKVDKMPAEKVLEGQTDKFKLHLPKTKTVINATADNLEASSALSGEMKGLSGVPQESAKLSGEIKELPALLDAKPEGPTTDKQVRTSFAGDED
jgi:hypothetical protein